MKMIASFIRHSFAAALPAAAPSCGAKFVTHTILRGHEATPPRPPAQINPGHGQANAADLYFDPALMARAREQLMTENGGMRTSAIIVERLEAGFDDDGETYGWHAQGWYGGDVNRFW
jgi:uncharacterized protein involved in copper resistance